MMVMRACDLAEAIIDRMPNLSSMKLQKLIYYVEGWHLAILDEPIYQNDPFLAFKNGPVVESVWRQYRSRATRTPAKRTYQLDNSASQVLDLVFAEYGGRTGDELSALTHAEKPWLDARKGLDEDAPSRNVIKDEDIANFFRAERTLGGRTAADIASGGLSSADTFVDDAFNVDDFLRDCTSPVVEKIDEPFSDEAFNVNANDYYQSYLMAKASHPRRERRARGQKISW